MLLAATVLSAHVGPADPQCFVAHAKVIEHIVQLVYVSVGHYLLLVVVLHTVDKRLATTRIKAALPHTALWPAMYNAHVASYALMSIKRLGSMRWAVPFLKIS